MHFILIVACYCAHSEMSFTCLPPIALQLPNSTGFMVSSMNRLPLSGTDAGPGEAAARLRAGLRALCADAGIHARFLNTLSLLEHLGSRKIMLARVEVRDGALLKHLAEETRHAFFFKRAAEKLARNALDYSPESTLAGAAARFYMDRLDVRVSAA